MNWESTYKERKTAFFHNGVLCNLQPRNKSVSLYEDRQVAYDIDSLIFSDGDVYDPMAPDTISQLSVPKFDHDGTAAVFDLSYILKMRCNLFDNPKVLPAFIQKTLDMMEASPLAWRRGDYLRVICNYYANGLFEAGDCFEAQYRTSHRTLFANPLDESQECEYRSTKYYFEDKWRRYQEYASVKAICPHIVPETARGYMQIRTRKTKRFQAIKEEAEKQGYYFTYQPGHYCRKCAMFVAFSDRSEHSQKYPMLAAIQCERQLSGLCDGRDEFGLQCGYVTK